jgi:ribosomal protein S18 acetylase RimI-like enzyme
MSVSGEQGPHIAERQGDASEHDSLMTADSWRLGAENERLEAVVVTVRPLVQSDAPAYRALRLRGLAEHPDAFTSDPEEEAMKPLAWTERRIGPKPEAPHDVVLGAFAAGETLIGVVGMDVDPRRKIRHRGHVFGMYVRPESRRKGVGRRLLDAVIERARAVGSLEQLALTVTAGNAVAQSLYEHAGFVAWGREREAIKVDGVAYDKVHMTMRLDTKPSIATEAR